MTNIQYSKPFGGVNIHPINKINKYKPYYDIVYLFAYISNNLYGYDGLKKDKLDFIYLLLDKYINRDIINYFFSSQNINYRMP